MRSTKRKIKLSEFIREFGKTVRLPKQKPRKPVILAIAGPSRVGKTTTLKFIGKKVPSFVRISNDDMRLFLYRKGFSAIKTEEFLYGSVPIFRLAELFLKYGYGVMLDANLVSRPEKMDLIKKLSKKFHAQFFVIRAWAPVGVVRRRLKGVKSELFHDWRVGLEHFERSRKQFDYEKLNKLYLTEVNTARPLAAQLKNAIKLLNDTMGIIEVARSV